MSVASIDRYTVKLRKMEIQCGFTLMFVLISKTGIFVSFGQDIVQLWRTELMNDLIKFHWENQLSEQRSPERDGRESQSEYTRERQKSPLHSSAIEMPNSPTSCVKPLWILFLWHHSSSFLILTWFSNVKAFIYV